MSNGCDLFLVKPCRKRLLRRVYMRSIKMIHNRYLLFLDVILGIGAYCLAVVSYFDPGIFMHELNKSKLFCVFMLMVFFIFMKALSVYSTDWLNASENNYFKLMLAVVTSLFTVGIGGAVLFNKTGFAIGRDFRFYLLCATLYGGLICAARFVLRVALKLDHPQNHKGDKRVLIVGAGALAVTLLREIAANRTIRYSVVGLIDDDKGKFHSNVCGAQVLGTTDDLEDICQKYDVEEIVFAIYRITNAKRVEILDKCSKTGIKVRILPAMQSSFIEGNGENLFKNIRDVAIDDLLERDPIRLDNDRLMQDIGGKVVLVTGGGGSIGSELCRQIMKFGPEKLVIVDIYENTTYELQLELNKAYPNNQPEVLIASVRDVKRLEEIFETYRPKYVFHAAAHKHVPLMEFSPAEAIKNNVFGTYNTARCAEKYGAERFVLISTDKAVNPTNVMGATKRLCEMIVQTMASTGKTNFVAVRFGNVLGSNGSVIPLFKKQISEGGPVTVTHPDITRFFMTIPEAAQLVLQASAYANGGEIFVLDMGKPVKIDDLAKKMISLSGLKLGEDIDIVYSGLRPGEKLYEELLMDEEGLKKTAHSKIFVGQPIEITADELQAKLDVLTEAITKDNRAIKEAVAKVVPTYTMKEE